MQNAFAELAASTCARPFDVLGLHEEADGRWVLRVFRPSVERVEVREPETGRRLATLTRLSNSDVFEGRFRERPGPYELAVTAGGQTRVQRDPYEFHNGMLFRAENRPYRLSNELGSHLAELTDQSGGPVSGVIFRVYAPSARSVSVVGEFNGWDGRVHPMQACDDGIWRLFVPGLGEGALYKYEVRAPRGNLLPLKSDPYGCYQEQAPANATIVYRDDRYDWSDAEYMGERDRRDPQSVPMSVYEVHLGSWRRFADHLPNYRQIADALVPYALDMGFTHIELLPVTEHPYYGSWGYQPTAMFAPTSRYGSPDDFKYFVDRCHRDGLGVILDWVPAHFPTDDNGLRQFDGTSLYEHPDPSRGWHPDWQTLIYDYGRAYVRDYLVSNALYWLREFHLDGLRVDAVASMLYLDYSREHGEWTPNRLGGNENLEAIDFIKELNVSVHREFPGATVIAEESTAWPKVSFPTWEGGLGFGFKWNMGWMHDTLKYFSNDPVHRKYHHHQITFSMVYAHSEHFILPLSHDEVVHGKGSLLGKMPGDDWQKFANLRALYAYMFSHPGRKLLFMGSELAPWTEWNHERELEWNLADFDTHRGIQTLLRRLNRLYTGEPALAELDFEPEGFRWINADDAENSVLTYERRARDGRPVIVALNLTPVPRPGYRIGVPQPGRYVELLNTDSGEFGGSGVPSGLGRQGLDAEAEPYHGREQSLALTLPPLAAVYFAPGEPA